jgi:hypothetical protein
MEKPEDTYQPERILAAVVMWEGIPISARRHSDCYKLIDDICKTFVSGVEIELDTNKEAQGFTTTHGRFVSREEAFKIAKKEKQIYHHAFDNDETGVLTSEDLW